MIFTKVTQLCAVFLTREGDYFVVVAPIIYNLLFSGKKHQPGRKLYATQLMFFETI
jgi:hypothetical protein